MFYDQVFKLCQQNGISLTSFVESGLKMSRSNVTKWREGKVPKSDTVQKIAAYFNVSTDYLLGNEQKNKPSAEAESLSNIEKEILRIYANLPEEKQKAFMTVVRALESQSKDK